MDRFYPPTTSFKQRIRFTITLRWVQWIRPTLIIGLTLASVLAIQFMPPKAIAQKINVPPKYSHTYTPLPKLPADALPPKALPWYKRLFTKKKPVKVDPRQALEVGPRTYAPSHGLMVRILWPICLKTPQGQQPLRPGIYLGHVDWPPSNPNSSMNSNNSTSQHAIQDTSQHAGQLSLSQHGHIYGAIALPYQQALAQAGYSTPDAIRQGAQHKGSPQLNLNQGTRGQLFFSVTQPVAKRQWMSDDVRCPRGLSL